MSCLSLVCQVLGIQDSGCRQGWSHIQAKEQEKSEIEMLRGLKQCRTRSFLVELKEFRKVGRWEDRILPKRRELRAIHVTI